MRCSFFAWAAVASFGGCAASLADIVPVSRVTNISAGWFQAAPPPNPVSGSASDGTTTFDYYSNSITTDHGGFASQTSYLVSNGAYATVTARGFDNGSFSQHTLNSGTSTFTYIFDLTSPITLYLTGSLNRSFFTTDFGSVRLYNDTTNAVVYQPSFSGGDPFAMALSFSDTYAAGAGRYRLVVSATNSGSGAAPTQQTSSATVLMTTPTPGAACLLGIGLVGAARRRR